MTDKYRYTIYPDRVYVADIDGEKMEIKGEDLINYIPQILHTKYREALLFDWDPLDNSQEGLVE